MQYYALIRYYSASDAFFVGNVASAELWMVYYFLLLSFLFCTCHVFSFVLVRLRRNRVGGQGGCNRVRESRYNYIISR